MIPPGIRYADLHFHTHYSDNRDRATVEEMVQRGRAVGISIFGTGDHNHNLTAADVRAEIAETAQVADRHPDLILMNNIEMTFLIGHFHLFNPGPINGSVDEAYHFLSGAQTGLMMANHPGLPTDQWNQRINPRFAAIEVINGSVLAEGLRRGMRPRSVLEIPSMETYVRYLRLGLPVAALGGSDAHALEELGTGFTGFRLNGEAGRGDVLDAIRQRRCFATTSVAIDLHWELDDGEGLFHWFVAIEPSANGRSPGNGTSPDDFLVEVFNCGERCAAIRPGSRLATGTIEVDGPGYYWIAVTAGDDLAVSSPTGYRIDELAVDPADRDRVERAELLLEEELRCIDLPASDLESERIAGWKGEVSLFSRAVDPVVVDARGVEIPLRITAQSEAVPIIKKECEPWRFEEFYVWLERNEVHEYRFLSLVYSFEEGLLDFRALLIPYRSDKRRGAEGLFREHVAPLKELIARAQRVRIDVSIPPMVTARLDVEEMALPFNVAPALDGVESRLTLLSALDGSDGAAAGGLHQFFV